MSPAEQQRWSRLHQLLVDLKPADLTQPVPFLIEEPPFTPSETLAAAEVEEPAPSSEDLPLEATPSLSQEIDSKACPASEGKVLAEADTEEPQAQAELARPQEVEARVGPPVEEVVLAQEVPEKPQEEAELALPEETFLPEALVGRTEVSSTPERLVVRQS